MPALFAGFKGTILIVSSQTLNPNCTGLFCTMIILGGGGGGALEAPPSDLGPKGADRHKIWHAPQKLYKEKDRCVIFLKNCIFYYL